MISVLIPAHNRERFIGEAIESVMRQTRPVDEVIVVDDASNDRTAAVARSYPGVQVVQLTRKLGVAGARNEAIARARGDLLAWQDSDDIWLPHHIETVVALLDQHPTAIVGFSGVEFFGERRGPVFLADVPVGRPFDAMRIAFGQQTISTMIAAVIRRSSIESVKGFDINLGAAVDFDLFLRLAAHGPFVCTREVTARYRWHGDQISSSLIGQIEAKYQSRQRFLAFLATSGRSREAGEFSQALVQSLHTDWWAAWTRRDPAGLAALVRLATTISETTPQIDALSRRNLSKFRRYCVSRGKTQGFETVDSDARRVLGRPTWLVKRAVDLELRYRFSRLTAPASIWVPRLIEAAYSWGRLAAPRS